MGRKSFCSSFGTQARMTVIFWTWQGCCYLLLSSTWFARTQRKISIGIFLTLFPFQPTASVCKEVRPRSKHISREYHRQHRKRATPYTAAAVNNPLKFLQCLWSEIQPHWEALVDSEEFQAKPTLPPNLTVSTAYTVDYEALRSIPLLHHCSRNHLLSLYSKNIHFQ